MDGGVALSGNTSLHAADSLGLSLDFIATESVSFQTEAIISNDDDSNGRLLYPDGAPRFRTIYSNGGRATDHGSSLGEEGRNRFRQFYYNGGSYTGSCAGAYLACLSWQENGIIPEYYHIWPGRMEPTSLIDSYTGHFIPQDSPLLDFFNFGGDHYIADIYHNGGGFAREDIDFPVGTEVLLRFDYPGEHMHQKISCWAYKVEESTGRIVVVGSHPETEYSSEGLQLMEAILLYALEGTAPAQLKGELLNSQTRVMDLATEDSLPAYTKIGDQQYHHFTIDIPQGAGNLSLILDGEDGFDLNLYLDADTFAFEPNADFSSIQPGADQTITVSSLSSGAWYVGVECATTINTAGQIYYGDLSVLNGVAYSITATWDSTGLKTTTDLAGMPDEFQLHQNYPNPFNPTTTIQYELPLRSDVQITIYDLLGRDVTTLVSETQDAGYKSVHWNATNVPSGMYFYRIEVHDPDAIGTGGYTQTKRMILLK
ncbi:MAG: T9SS type A sorting domain-containing protein [Candidatus Marinimicrobia bacterium]|nr:T9SS type A sorting domain-containing protein [Candidatus Neomarinimicrobiota bacterium]